MKNNQISLGRGYSNDKAMITLTHCLKNYDSKLIGHTESIIRFGDSLSSSEVARDLGLGLKISAVVYPCIMGSVSGTYATYLQESNYSKSFSFLYQVEFGNEVLQVKDYGVNVLNEFGMNAYKAGPEQFRESCGDQFIVQQKLGARLYTTMRLTFVSTEDKLSFSLGVGATLDLLALTIGVKLAYNQMIDHQDINLSIEIAAYQEGGDVIKLAKIFNKDGTGKYNAVSCDISDMDACEQVVSDIINYAKLDFIKQIGYKAGVVNVSYAVIGDVYMDYNKIGLASSNTTITEDIREIREWLLDQHEINTNEQEFLENLLYKSKFYNIPSNDTSNSTLNLESGYKEFDIDLRTVGAEYTDYNVTHGYWTWSPEQIFSDMRFTLINSLKNIGKNLALLNSKEVGILKCYADPFSCQKLTLQPINSEDIDGFKKAYQVIVVCGEAGYGRYFLPVDRDIYQAKAKFDLGQNKTILSDINYKITNGKSNTIDILLYNDELTRNGCSCGSIDAREEDSVVSIYEGAFIDSEGCECASILCGSSSSNQIGTVVGKTDVIFIEIQSPI